MHCNIVYIVYMFIFSLLCLFHLLLCATIISEMNININIYIITGKSGESSRADLLPRDSFN